VAPRVDRHHCGDGGQRAGRRAQAQKRGCRVGPGWRAACLGDTAAVQRRGAEEASRPQGGPGRGASGAGARQLAASARDAPEPQQQERSYAWCRCGSCRSGASAKLALAAVREQVVLVHTKKTKFFVFFQHLNYTHRHLK